MLFKQIIEQVLTRRGWYREGVETNKWHLNKQVKMLRNIFSKVVGRKVCLTCF